MNTHLASPLNARRLLIHLLTALLLAPLLASGLSACAAGAEFDSELTALPEPDEVGDPDLLRELMVLRLDELDIVYDQLRTDYEGELDDPDAFVDPDALDDIPPEFGVLYDGYLAVARDTVTYTNQARELESGPLPDEPERLTDLHDANIALAIEHEAIARQLELDAATDIAAAHAAIASRHRELADLAASILYAEHRILLPPPPPPAGAIPF